LVPTTDVKITLEEYKDARISLENSAYLAKGCARGWRKASAAARLWKWRRSSGS
jgi:hypothetical protein